MPWLRREWSSVLTIGCIIVAAIIEAWQQALAGSPKVAETLPSLNGSWHYVPLGLLVLAGVFWLIGYSNKPSQQDQQQGTALQSSLGSSVQPPVDFDATKFFRLAYHSDWTADIETRIRIAAHQNQPNDPESFYTKFIGVGLVAYYHDIVWAYIFKSQILALTELNRKGGVLSLVAARGYYETAAAKWPKNYSEYSFERWIAFLKSHDLLIQHPSDMLEITIRGRDFLKYLTHRGWSLDSRSF